MPHRKTRLTRKAGEAIARSVRRTIYIRTSSCAAAHHEQCYHSAFDRGVVFQCACSCHASRQMPPVF